MGFRFRKRIKIIPGVALNLTESGVSTTLGGKYGRVTVGKRGITPGASAGGGLYYQGKTRTWTEVKQRQAMGRAQSLNALPVPVVPAPTWPTRRIVKYLLIAAVLVIGGVLAIAYFEEIKAGFLMLAALLFRGWGNKPRKNGQGGYG
jgi:hypothetical protein